MVPAQKRPLARRATPSQKIFLHIHLHGIDPAMLPDHFQTNRGVRRELDSASHGTRERRCRAQARGQIQSLGNAGGACSRSAKKCAGARDWEGATGNVARSGAGSGAAKTGGAETASQCPEAKSVTTQRWLAVASGCSCSCSAGEELSKVATTTAKARIAERQTTAERTESLVSTGCHRGWSFPHCLVNGKRKIVGRQRCHAASLQIGRGDRDGLRVVQILDGDGCAVAFNDRQLRSPRDDCLAVGDFYFYLLRQRDELLHWRDRRNRGTVSRKASPTEKALVNCPARRGGHVVENLDFHDRMNFPRGRSPWLMVFVCARSFRLLGRRRPTRCDRRPKEGIRSGEFSAPDARSARSLDPGRE